MLNLSERRNCFYWQTDRDLSVKDYEKIFLKRHDVAPQEVIRILQAGITVLPHIKTIELIPADENVLKGNVNIVRKVIINNQEFVVRMHPKGVKNGYFFVEKTILEQLKVKELPVPEVLEVHTATGENDMDFMLMTVAPGITMDVLLSKDKEPENQLLHSAGSLMARIHEINVHGFGSFDNRIAKTENQLAGLHKNYHDFIWSGLEENLQRLIKFEVIQVGQSVNMQRTFENMNFEPFDTARLIHNDYADWNLLTDGKIITGILDWDESHAGDPVADLACWSTFFSMDRFATFLEGYKLVGSLPVDFDTRFHFYRLRYTISKMALRVKRFQVDKSDFLKDKIRVGKEALLEETAFFGI
ncbi:aminoglycoside phosphotransferase family protein [Candidatus Roizmanbacteria bacterium]|nr:aminoglycoside phosphotransferase family protein [Candidatus Roizmanbacteria bacterium]